MSAAQTDKPRHLLLATDLSARCDRARDRALALAAAWGARLTVVHALDITDVPNDQPPRPTLAGAAARAMRLMRADFAGIEEPRIEFRVEEGRPADVVLAAAAESGCDLIVAGIAGNDPLGQSLLGSTVAALTRRAFLPVLVVKKRPRGAYGRVVVASDFSEASAVALRTGLRLFAPEQITLFHAFSLPFRNWSDDKAGSEEGRQAEAVDEMKAFLAESAGAADASAIRVVARRGDPAALVSDHAARENVDLVIAGTQGRKGLMNVLLGSVAISILDEVPCDIMIVPRPREGATGNAQPARGEGREDRSGR